jgi:hypothetical protein
LGTPETGAQEIFNPENPYGKYFLGLYLTLFLGSRIASAGRWLPVRRRAVAGERQQAGVRHADQVAAGARANQALLSIIVTILHGESRMK